MRAQRMVAQRSQVEERLSLIGEEMLSSATKYVIDSVYEDRYRVLVSHLRRPISRSAGIEGLASFEAWEAEGGDEFLIRERKNAFSEFGIRADQVEEGRVFVRLPGDGKALEITEFVRDESKSHYKALIMKERAPRRGV